MDLENESVIRKQSLCNSAFFLSVVSKRAVAGWCWGDLSGGESAGRSQPSQQIQRAE